MSERLDQVSSDELLNRGIMAILKRIIVKHYPLPLAVVVPEPLFLSIIDNVVRSLPEQTKLGGVVAVKEQVDALVNLYVSEWMLDKINPKNRPEMEKMESHLRALGLLY